MSFPSGTLTVHVIDGVQLPVVNKFGKQCPFVVIKLGAARQQSKSHINGHRCPVWGDRLQFNLDGSEFELQVEVYHESKLSGSTFIGRAILPLQQVLSSTQNITRRVRIGDAGEIRLQLAFSEASRRASSLAHPGQDTMLGQAMENATSSLEHLGNPGQRAGMLNSTPAAKLQAQKKQQRPQGEGPAWMYGNSASRPQAAPSEPSATDLIGNFTNGSQSKPQAIENAKPPVGTSHDKASTSPTKSFRAKIRNRLGISGGKSHKEPSKAEALSTHDSDSTPEVDPKPAPDIMLHPGLNTEPSSSRSSMLDSQEVPHPAAASEHSNDRHDDLIDLNDDHPSTSTAGLHSSGGHEQPSAAPATASRRSSASWMDQGLSLEPVEAVRYNLPEGGEAWLSKWERQHDSKPRRATESTFDFEGRGSEWPQAPRRQTTESFAGMPSRPMTEDRNTDSPQRAAPLMEAPLRASGGNNNSSNDKNEGQPQGDSGFYRGGFQLREWGERHGQMPHSKPMFSSNFPDRMPPEHQWDVKASHEHMRLRMQEMSRKFASNSYQGRPHQFSSMMDGGAPRLRAGSPESSGFMDTAMRTRPTDRIGDNTLSSASSAQELGRQETSAPKEGTDTADDDLEVVPRERSDSAPATSSAGPTNISYPQPSYEDSGISSHFADLDPCNSPPPFNSALQAREQAMYSRPGEAPQLEQEGRRHTRDHSDTPATPRSRAGAAEAEFGDTARVRPRDSRASLDQPRGRQAEVEGEAMPDDVNPSFRGILSPFAEDSRPLEEETLPDNDLPDTVAMPSHARTKSGGRVPIKDIRREMEAEAPASVRVPRTSTASDDSKPSLQALLSDSKQDWLIDEKDLEIAVDERGKAIKLGSGAFGTVYKGVYDQSTEVAIKHLKYETQKDMDEALYEVAILKKQLHPNVLQFLGASIGDGSIQLVTELMAGNLYKALRNGKCTWYKGGRSISKNIASALAFLHKKKVVHLDVKSANILLTSNNVAKLGDLGLSAMVNTDSFVNTLKGLGTLQWASPEVLLGTHPVTSASDVYSFGTVLWEICTGDIPQKPLRHVNDRAHPNEAPREVAMLIEKCLSTEPSDRPTMQEAYLALKDL